MIQIGFGKAEITPVFSVFLGGYEKREEVSKGVHLPIYTRVMISKYRDNQLVFISLELLGVDLDFTNEIRRKVGQILSIPNENIVVAATHTHSSFENFPANMYKGLWQDSPKKDENIRELIFGKILEAVQRAEQNKQNASVYFGRGVGNIGGNRRVKGGPFDNEILLLKFVSETGNILGTIVNYSCHPTILSHSNAVISGDYAGWVMQGLENEDSVCLFFNGAAGDISTRFQRKEPTFSEVERLGNILLHDIKTVNYKQIRITNIKAEEQKITLKQKNGKEISTVLQIVQMGEIIFFSFPGELFTEEGLKLKKIYRDLFILGYSNDYIGYIITDHTYEENGYEVEVTRFDKSQKNKLMDSVRRMLNQKIHNLQR